MSDEVDTVDEILTAVREGCADTIDESEIELLAAEIDRLRGLLGMMDRPWPST